jgi:hypothetical protein
MNIVFAYHDGDAELAMASAEAIAAQGINMRHRATICASNGTPLVSQIKKKLEQVFPTVERIVAQEGFDGWPLGPNQLFSDASNYCFMRDDPWMFWEPDCVPMVSNWVDILDKEFARDQTKIMGCLLEGGVAPSGKTVHRLIVGSAIYPAKFLYGCTVAANLFNYNLRYRDAKAVPEPWDVRCRWEFLKFGRNTELIKTYWKSCKYRIEGGAIVFSAENQEAEDIQHVTCPDKTVSPKAVVVHGCKDGSLHKMAQEGFPMPSDSTGLNTPSNSMGLERGGTKIPPPLLQGVCNDAQCPAVCNTLSDKVEIVTDGELAPYPVQVLCEAVGMVKREERLRAVKKDAPKAKNKSSQKAKKKRVISEAERERRRQSMLAILAKKREQKAQSAV